MDLDLDLDSIFNGFGSGFGFKCVLGLDWILDLKKFMDLDLDLDLFLDMDSNPNPRIQIRTSLMSTKCNVLAIQFCVQNYFNQKKNKFHEFGPKNTAVKNLSRKPSTKSPGYNFQKKMSSPHGHLPTTSLQVPM